MMEDMGEQLRELLFKTLKLLTEEGALNKAQLSRGLGKPKTWCGGWLSALWAYGLVEPVACSAHMRYFKLTQKGWEKLRELEREEG